MRRWWSRRPWLVDGIVAGVYFVLAALLILQVEILEAPDVPSVLRAVAILLGTTAAVLLRRRWTVSMSLVVLALGFFSMFQGASADLFAIPIMLFSLAVHRSIRLAAFFFMLFVGASLLVPLLPWAPPGAQADEFDAILLVLSAVLGLLIGTATRSRRDYVGSLMERAAQREELAAAHERRRIAREMHDIVSHTLTVVVMLADGAAASREEERARSAMRGAADAARGALSELRGLLGALRDDEAAPLAPQPTARDLPELVRRFVQAGLPVRLHVTGVPDESPAVSFAVYRIVQEGLTNALRYSDGATRTEAAVDYLDDGVDVVVENDGAIVNASSVGARQGLRGLRERLDLLGGRIESGSAGDGVWRLQAWIPRGASIGGGGR